MSLSREKLRAGYFQALARDNPLQPTPLTEEELTTSLQATMANAPDDNHTWIYAYGSLIWNPLLEFDQQIPVSLYGYRRRFCLKTMFTRGCEEHPGLILGLMPGGSCRGLALRLSGPQMRDELQLLWRREMVTSAYQPKWVTLHPHDPGIAQSKPVRAIAFVMNRDYPHFEGQLNLEQTAGMLSRARGPLGTSAEYLFNTQESLLQHGIRDVHLTEVAQRVQELIDIHGQP